MHVIVRLTLLLAGALWFIFVMFVILWPPELCGTIPGYLSPDERSLKQYSFFGGFFSMAPLYFAMVYPRRLEARKILVFFGVVVVASGLAVLCCYGVMQYISLSHHCGGVTVD
ncbi:hypothetical protein [Pantoea ananatis]|uniref:hypothetical protein n=1 Tax=Pantoea ananas TaxID=553 RepID=UPI00301A9790